MAINLRLANLLTGIALITGGLQHCALAQTESAGDAAASGADVVRKPQSPDEAIDFLMRAVRKGSDADVDALLPDTFVDAFQKARTAARAKAKACERLAEAMKFRSFGKEGEDLAKTILALGWSRFDLWTEWKTTKIVERKKRTDGRVLVVLYIEFPSAAQPDRPAFARTQFWPRRPATVGVYCRSLNRTAKSSWCGSWRR